MILGTGEDKKAKILQLQYGSDPCKIGPDLIKIMQVHACAQLQHV